jgi:hypothetical protein
VSSARTPEPRYITDQVTGTLSESALYVDLDLPTDQPILARGTFAIRYAIPVLTPPGIVIIPGLFVSERGQMMTGRECWDYLQTRFQLHPRADVVGIKPDSEPVQFLVRALDFGADIQVLAYSDPPDSAPIATVSAVFASDQAFAMLPDLLKRYLPRR